MFHPNVYNDGNLCLDILQNRFALLFVLSLTALLTLRVQVVTDL